MRDDIIIRPETRRDYKDIITIILRAFREGTDYSDGTDVLAFVEEIREGEYYIPELAFIAELRGRAVGHFMFSRFPLSQTKEGGARSTGENDILMLAPVAVHPEFFRQGVGTAMLTLGIAEAIKFGCKGVTLEGDYRFYNRLGFRTSSDFGIFPTGGFPMADPRCMMCLETSPGSLAGIRGYVVYDMYYNA